MKYKITAVAHNKNFFTNPDRVIFEMFGEFEDYSFIKDCEKKAKQLLDMDYPMEMYFNEIL